MTTPKRDAPKPYAPKLPTRGVPYETEDDNVKRQSQTQGDVRPDGPGDETAPVPPQNKDEPGS